jgi:hypothetical protein
MNAEAAEFDAARTVLSLVDAGLNGDNLTAVQLLQPWSNDTAPLIRQFIILTQQLLSTGAWGEPHKLIEDLRQSVLDEEASPR